jgi:membrane protein implicated in regulation of membrane protease activity
MIHLTGGILLVLEYGLAVFAFVDVLRSAESAVPWVPRWGWVVGILVFPLVGAVVWLAATHKRRLKLRSRTAADGDEAAAEQAGLAQAADAVRRVRVGRLGSLEEDAALLAQLWDVNDEHERTLQRWEEDLCRREEALRQRLQRERVTRGRQRDAA